MREALQNPAFCSSCFQAKPNTLHIDFEVAYDGPVINDEDGIKVAIDDLIICADCLTAAGKFVGMVAGDELKAENVELGSALEDATQRLEKQEEIIHDLKAANGKLIDAKIKRRPGRPKKSIRVAT